MISSAREVTTAAGTTTLTVADAQQQIFTGSTTQTVVLPVTTVAYQVGLTYRIINESSGTLTINASDSSNLLSMTANSSAIVIALNNNTVASTDWNYTYFSQSAGGLDQLSGDSGSATPSGGNINIIADGGTGYSVAFTGSSDQIVLTLTDADLNTMLGKDAGASLISGSGNVGLGRNAGSSLTTGSNNIFIGTDTSTLVDDSSGNIAIGGGPDTDLELDNSIFIGCSQAASFSTICYIGGINGVSVGSGNTQVVVMGTGANKLGTANLAAGTGIDVTGTDHAITISATGTGALAWSIVTTTTAMDVNSGYIANDGSQLVFTLPSTSAPGDQIAVIGEGAGGWQIALNSGQSIRVGTSVTTTTTGTITSANRYDTILLTCTADNTTWACLGAPQSSGLTIT